MNSEWVLSDRRILLKLKAEAQMTKTEAKHLIQQNDSYV